MNEYQYSPYRVRISRRNEHGKLGEEEFTVWASNDADARRIASYGVIGVSQHDEAKILSVMRIEIESRYTRS